MKKYDVLYKNGKIFTSDKDNLHVQAMAVKDGRIAWTGSDSEAASVADEAVKTVDLRGKRVLPGFVDSHMHAIMLADCYQQISALPPSVNSIEELTKAIAAVREKQPAGRWIYGWGYDEGKFAEKRAPLRQDLDRGCSDSPVIVKRTCGHICAVNSKALEMAGVTADTPDPEGGRIGRDENGEPNGILYENARNVLNGILPEKTVEDMADDLVALNGILVSQGVTTGADMGEFMDADYKTIYGRAIEKGMKIKVAGYYMWDEVRDKEGFTITAEDQSPANQFRVAGIKLIGDGSVSGRTAWCDRPYLGGEDEYGIPVCTDEDIEEALAFCKEHGCQLSIHAMGARTIDRAVAHIWQEQPWVSAPNTPSLRIEHVAMPTADAIEKAARSGIAFVTQPIFLYAEIESYLVNMGIERTRENYPIADWIKAGVRFAFSTDAPATAWAQPSDPFVCLKGAVTRKAYDGTDCGPRHRVDIEQAIMLYTAESAPMLGFEDVGMIKEGYSADFIILDTDILAIPAEDIDKVKVEETYINGEQVYSR